MNRTRHTTDTAIISPRRLQFGGPADRSVHDRLRFIAFATARAGYIGIPQIVHKRRGLMAYAEYRKMGYMIAQDIFPSAGPVQIGRAFNRDHSCIYNGISSIKSYQKFNPGLWKEFLRVDSAVREMYANGVLQKIISRKSIYQKIQTEVFGHFGISSDGPRTASYNFALNVSRRCLFYFPAMSLPEGSQICGLSTNQGLKSKPGLENPDIVDLDFRADYRALIPKIETILQKYWPWLSVEFAEI